MSFHELLQEALYAFRDFFFFFPQEHKIICLDMKQTKKNLWTK